MCDTVTRDVVCVRSCVWRRYEYIGTKLQNLLMEKMDLVRRDPQGNLRRSSNTENIRVKVRVAQRRLVGVPRYPVLPECDN